MSEQENVQTARQAYAFFNSGDIESLVGLFTEDVQWETPEVENMPQTGKRTGIASVREFMSLINENMEALEFEPREFIAQGDRVVVLGHYRWRVKRTGKEYASDWAHVCTYRDGKLTSFKEYLDTAAARDAHSAAQTANR